MNQKVILLVIVFFMCCLSSQVYWFMYHVIGCFYTLVAKSLGKVLEGTFAMHATLSTLATALTLLKISKVIKKYSYKKVLLNRCYFIKWCNLVDAL